MFNNRSKSIWPRLAYLVVLAVWTKSASAVGMGSIQINSGLGQPLRANIPLLAVSAGDVEPSCIKASVESADGAFLTSPQIGLVSKGAPPAIVLSSKQAMMEPALTLRVSLSCGIAISRDYQILLDPPQYELATSSERQPSPAAAAHAEMPPAAAATEASQPAARPAPVRRSLPAARTQKPHKPVAAAPKVAAAPPKPTPPQRSVLKITNADVAAAPIAKQGPASAPASAPTKELMPGSAPAAPALPASAIATSTTQPDLQMYALQAQMKDQIQALQKEMAAMRQQNQLDKAKFDELHKTSVSPQVMQGMVGLLLLCLGAIGWLGWRLYRLKNNYHLE